MAYGKGLEAFSLNKNAEKPPDVQYETSIGRPCIYDQSSLLILSSYIILLAQIGSKSCEHPSGHHLTRQGAL